MSPISTAVGVRRIRFWQHRRAVRQMMRAYLPGVDALVDRLRATGMVTRFALLQIILPLYFAREQGWVVPGDRGEMAAVMYLRRNARRGIAVLHIDDINVDERYRHRGFARRLMALAESIARQEQRSFLKLAVTVANTPAVTLYRQLGYQEQHHRYLTRALVSAEALPALASDVRLRRIGRRQAAQALARFSRLELLASNPAVADLMATYYPLGGDLPRRQVQTYAIEHNGQPAGYAGVFRQGTQWKLLLGMLPEHWGADLERQAIQLLTSAVAGATRHGDALTLALYVPSGAHFDALSAGSSPVAGELGFVEQRFDRMIMVKVLAEVP